MTSVDIMVLGKDFPYYWYLSHSIKCSVLKNKSEVNQMVLRFSFTVNLKFLFFFILKEYILDLWEEGQTQKS